MQATARTVLQALDGARTLRLDRIGSIDRSSSDLCFRAPKASAELTPGEHRWMRYMVQLRKLSKSLRRLHPLRKLDGHIEQLERRYRGETAIRDGFLASWLLTNASVDGSHESLATIVAELVKALKAPDGLVETAEVFAASYCGFYRIVDREDGVVQLEELVTQDRFTVRLSRRYPGPVGAIWWVRLLPNRDRTWTAFGAPYVFSAPDAGDRLLAYFSRVLMPLDAETYRHFLRGGPTPGHWLEFIVDASFRRRDSSELEGVPDQFELLPSARTRDLPLGDPGSQARSTLFMWAAQAGWTRRAVEAFRVARRHFGLDDRSPLRWSEAERLAAEAYALYGHVDDAGHTALEVALRDERGRFGPSHEAHLESVRLGWFSVLQVEDLGDDEGLGLRDVLRRRHLRIATRSVDRRISVGDLLLGWVAVEADGVHRLEGSVMRAPASVAVPLVRTMRRLNALFRDSLPELPLTKRCGLLAPYAALAVVRLTPSPGRAVDERRVEPKPRRGRKRAPARQLTLFDMSEFELRRPSVDRPQCSG